MMTASDLLDLLATQLVRRCGGSRRRWRAVLGTLRLYDAATHPHCNWSLAPSGGAGEVAAVESLLDEIRIRHPLIAAD
jgi:hypothetical protein